MFKKAMLMAALLLSLGATHAQAQTFGQRNATEDFTGPYVGGTVGYSWGDFDASGTVGGVSFSDDPDMDGWQGGVLGGYGFQFGEGYNYVWNGFMGIEVGYEWSNADGSAFGVDVDKEDALIITARPGFTWGDMALGYGIIGYSRTQFEAANEEEWLDGLVLGVGSELYTMGPLKTRLEYVYTNYEDVNYAVPGGSASLEGQDHALKLGAVFRF